MTFDWISLPSRMRSERPAHDTGGGSQNADYAPGLPLEGSTAHATTDVSLLTGDDAPSKHGLPFLEVAHVDEPPSPLPTHSDARSVEHTHGPATAGVGEPHQFAQSVERPQLGRSSLAFALPSAACASVDRIGPSVTG
jgi:hypothetical protein